MKRDKESFLAILEQHKLIVFKVCNSYCRDKEDQKDLVQEVIIQLWSGFEKYDEQFKLSTWIYRIALNTAISYYRKSNTRNRHFTPLDSDFIEITEEETINYSDEVKLLRQFINQLDDLNRALMILYLDDHSHEEIARILNVSKSNVGTKINRIKDKLRNQFKNIKA